MQIGLFTIVPGDARALDELNRFLRAHRVLTVDRQFEAGSWSFCVTYQGAVSEDADRGSNAPPRVDYREILDAPTFALFSRLRDVRKVLAERDKYAPYTVFTNEQLAEISRQRCTAKSELEKISGVGAGRIEKYGDAILAAVAEHLKPTPAPTAAQAPEGKKS